MTRRIGYVILYARDDLRSEFIASLSPVERWIWLALRMLLSDCPYRPILCSMPNVAFTDSQIAGYMGVSTMAWKKAKKKFIEKGKIQILKHGILVTKWRANTEKKRAGSKRIKEWDGNVPTKEELEKFYEDRRKTVELYENLTGSRYSADAPGFVFVFNRRKAEGATYEQIETAVRTYVMITRSATPYKSKRMSLLNVFNGKTFWKCYKANYPAVVMSETTSQMIKRMTGEEKDKAHGYSKSYSEQMDKYMNTNGLTSIYDIDWRKVMTCKQYIKRSMEK